MIRGYEKVMEMGDLELKLFVFDFMVVVIVVFLNVCQCGHRLGVWVADVGVLFLVNMECLKKILKKKNYFIIF